MYPYYTSLLAKSTQNLSVQNRSRKAGSGFPPKLPEKLHVELAKVDGILAVIEAIHRVSGVPFSSSGLREKHRGR